MLIGCGDRPQNIVVDNIGGETRFIIHHRGWPRPFKTPRVTEFALSRDLEERVWELQADAPAGVEARDLAIVYGQTPAGFRQVWPEDGSRPRPLRPGANYFAAAAGPTQVYRTVYGPPYSTTQPFESMPQERRNDGR